MKNRFEFTFSNLHEYYKTALKKGYEIITCEDYVLNKKSIGSLTIINRIDVDFLTPSLKKAEKLLEMYIELNIRGTFFIRLHASEYNPFSFENYRILKRIRDSGNEIGYHSEIVDQSVIWSETAEDCLKKDIAVLNTMLGIKVKGVASHGGRTGLNNLDFWKERKPEDFGLLYEAYDTEDNFNLFNNSFYISDSEWTRWKCYDNGVLVKGDNRTFGEHLVDKHPVIYLLTHPDTFFENHFYE